MEQLRRKHGSGYEQPTAIPMLTDAYNLPARKVIHIVGPIVQYKLTPELEEDLANCYRNTLDMCAENGLKSVAFCCISTGVFRFPNKRAAEIAVETVTDLMRAYDKGAFDVVTRATTNHGLHRGSYQCMATIYDTDGKAYEVSSWNSASEQEVLTNGQVITFEKRSNHIY